MCQGQGVCFSCSLTKFVSFSANFNVQTFGGDCFQPRFVSHCADGGALGGERSLRVE